MCIGEMTQMAGRAGRRGKDKVGTVIIAAWSDLPFEPQLQQLLTGLATKLVSKFRYALVYTPLYIYILKADIIHTLNILHPRVDSFYVQYPVYTYITLYVYTHI